MSGFLLDTSVVSELRKPRPHPIRAAWFARLRPEEIFVSAVTLGELQFGVENLRARQPERAVEIETWIKQRVADERILPMDAACFREWGRILPAQAHHLVTDAMIAATARVRHLTVATRNERHFRQLGVAYFNPFGPA